MYIIQYNNYILDTRKDRSLRVTRSLLSGESSQSSYQLSCPAPLASMLRPLSSPRTNCVDDLQQTTWASAKLSPSETCSNSI